MMPSSVGQDGVMPLLYFRNNLMNQKANIVDPDQMAHYNGGKG
jgi:hypothetical protein